MPVAATPLVERIARVLAGQRLSANADGPVTSAALDVDIEWQDDVGDAIAVLKALREPDQAMAAAGDADIWHRMICAAIEEAADHGEAPE
ncbi:hypothetical protein [Sphingobium nicotianae]|uniref:Uncharacterized protein n=1 Tax=Sphingobium nicotianae TaxID=2782607 RepID=A0A9X1DBC8_9SPHN|nr:hypothetical protein [Sphingobium nicotianae]MBT2186770.1 hypothetical protein [Sphingobium nicotianae]